MPDSENAEALNPSWRTEAAYFNGREAKAYRVEVAMAREGLELRGEVSGFHPKESLRLLDRQAGGRFRLALREPEGAVLEFDDAQAWRRLRDLRLLGGGWSGAWSDSSASLGTRRGLFVLVSAMVLFGFWFYGFGLDWSANTVTRMLPRSLDAKIGETAALDSVMNPSKLTEAALAALAHSARVLQGLDDLGPDSIHILVWADTDNINAYAFPGGRIAVTTGMLRHLTDQDMWFALIAHEGGHLKYRHGMRQIVRASLLYACTSLLVGDVSGLGAALAENGGMLVRLHFSRKDEMEADDFALRKMRDSGRGTAGLGRLFKMLLKEEKDFPKWAAFFSTHPATAERLNRLDSKEPAVRMKPFLSAQEWNALKKF